MTGPRESELLVRRAASGDRDSQDALWREHRRFVAAVLVAHLPRGLSIEDTLQDVALAFVRRLSTLDDPSKLRPWLRSVAIHSAASAARRASPERRAVDPEANVESRLAAAENGGAFVAEVRDEAARVREQLHRLPPEFREPLVLRILDGLSQKEIAAALGLAETTIETRLVRARRMIREALMFADGGGSRRLST